MIKFITTYLEKKAKAKQDLIDQDLVRTDLKRKNWIKEIKALRLITIKNVSYIKASITVLKSVANNAKGSNGAATKRIRESVRERLSWLQRNLSEEEGMIIYYNSLLKKI